VAELRQATTTVAHPLRIVGTQVPDPSAAALSEPHRGVPVADDRPATGILTGLEQVFGVCFTFLIKLGGDLGESDGGLPRVSVCARPKRHGRDVAATGR
jgi:hypothetical protein